MKVFERFRVGAGKSSLSETKSRKMIDGCCVDNIMRRIFVFLSSISMYIYHMRTNYYNSV
jgi:hypothetical protein